MARKTVLERAIDEIDAEIAEANRKHASHIEVLQHSRDRLVAQNDAAIARRKPAAAPAGEPCDDRR